MDRDYIINALFPLFNNTEMKCDKMVEEIKTDIPNELIVHGDRYYVYGLWNCVWNNFFYIGKGCGNRINDNNRNPHVKKILSNSECLRVFIIDGLTESSALDVEKYIKGILKEKGSPLIDNEGKIKNQREGIERAKLQGKYVGRKRKQIDKDKLKDGLSKYYHREITKCELAKLLNVSRPTLDRILKGASE